MRRPLTNLECVWVVKYRVLISFAKLYLNEFLIKYFLNNYKFLTASTSDNTSQRICTSLDFLYRPLVSLKWLNLVRIVAYIRSRHAFMCHIRTLAYSGPRKNLDSHKILKPHKVLVSRKVFERRQILDLSQKFINPLNLFNTRNYLTHSIQDLVSLGTHAIHLTHKHTQLTQFSRLFLKRSVIPLVLDW